MAMARWLVAITSRPTAHRYTAPTTTNICLSAQAHDDTQSVIVAVVSLEAKTITWHVLASAASTEVAMAHVRVLLDDLRWRDGSSQPEDISLCVPSVDPPLWAESLRNAAQSNGHCVSRSTTEPSLTDCELRCENVQLMLSPNGIRLYQSMQHTMNPCDFDCCVDATYEAMAVRRAVLGNPRLERAFHLTVKSHSTPLRPYLRLDETTQRLWIHPSALVASPSIRAMLRPLCRTKHGKRRLQERLEKPETNQTLLHQRHDHLSELVTSLAATDTVGPALVAVLDCIVEAETAYKWFCREAKSGPSPSLQDFEGFCRWLQHFCSTTAAFHSACEAAQLPLLIHSYASRLVSTASSVSVSFADAAWGQLRQFQTGDEQNAKSPGYGLRTHLMECEKAIHAHRTEAATMLLLSPERIRIVFEDDDLASARSTAPSVVFRVTRQDGHRVFQASADRETPGVTLVHSRRTTGVWFSTQQLDILAAQRRALKLDLARDEAQLVASLVHDYNARARDKVYEVFSIIADLDVLSVFAQVTIRHAFVRATIQDDPRVLEVNGLRWPWDDARTTVQAPTLHLDGAYRLLAIHSAVDADATILGRLALAVVLNQAGCFVPCTSARLPVFDAVFLRSGTIDDTLANKSTFLAEMQQMRGILDRATPTSLVLMEELCRGTAPEEGLPVAVAISQFLVDKCITTCLATQWTELLDTLLTMEHVTVPAVRGNALASVETMKRAYSEQLQYCNFRFLSRLQDLDFPRDLIDGVRNDLSNPP